MKQQSTILQQTEYLLNNKAISVIYSLPKAGKTSLIREKICNPEFLSKNNAKAIIVDIPVYSANAIPLQTIVASALKDNIKEPLFIDITFKDDNSIWFAAKKMQIKHKEFKRFYLIIDSFENVFTYPISMQTTFAEQLSTIINNEIPNYVAEHLQQMLINPTENTLSGDAITLLYNKINIGIMLAVEQSLLPNTATLNPAFANILSQNAEIKNTETTETTTIEELYKQTFNNIPNNQHNKIINFVNNEMILDNGTLPAFKQTALQKYNIDQQNLDTLTNNNIFCRKVSPQGHEYYELANNHLAQLFSKNKPQTNNKIKHKISPLLFGSVAIIILCLCTVFVAFSLKQTVERNSSAARSNSLSTFAFQKLETDPTFSLRLAQKAVKYDTSNQQAYSALLNSFYKTDIFYDIKTHISENTIGADISNNGNFITTIEQYNDKSTLRISTIDGENIALIPHPDIITSATISQDGNYIATSSYDSIARIYSIDGQLIKTIDKHQAILWRTEFSPNGSKIATAGSDANVMIWDTLGNLITTLKGHNQDVYYIAFAPDGNHIATGGLDNTIKIWTTDGHLITTIEDNENYNQIFMSVVYSPDGKYLLTASNDIQYKGHKAILWNLEGKKIATCDGHEDWINSAFFSPDSKMIITASRDHTVRVYDLNGNQKKILKGHDSNVFAAKFTDNNQQIITVGNDFTIRQWTIGRRFETYPDADNVKTACFSPDGINIAVVKDKNAYLWDLTGETITTFEGHTASINSIKFAHNGKLIATTSNDQTVRIWDTKGNIVKIITNHNKIVNDAVFSPDDNYLVSVSDDSTIVISNLITDENIIAKGHSNGVTSIAFWPDGNYFVTGGNDRKVIIHSISGEIIREFIGHNGKINSVNVSPNGNYVISASADKSAVLWDKFGNIQYTFRGYGNIVNSAEFSPNGNYIVTTSDDGYASLWTPDGKDIIKFKHDGCVTSATFSPDGKYLMSTYNNTKGGQSLKVVMIDASTINRHIDQFDLYGPVWIPDSVIATKYGM